MKQDERFGITVSLYDREDMRKVFAVAPTDKNSAEEDLEELIMNTRDIKNIFRSIFDRYTDREMDSICIRGYYFTPSDVLKEVFPSGVDMTVYDISFSIWLREVIREEIIPSLKQYVESSGEYFARDREGWSHTYDNAYGEMRFITVASEPYTWYIVRSTDPNSTEGMLLEDLYTDFESAELGADNLWESDLKAVYEGLPLIDQTMFVFDIIEVTMEFFDIRYPKMIPADFVQATRWEFRDAYGIE